MARSTLYRRRQPVTPKPKRRPRRTELSTKRREEVLGALHCERFVDKAPAQVWATLLDEGTYLCVDSHDVSDFGGAWRGPRAPEPTAPSELHQAGAVGRSAQPGHITKLRGPVKSYYYLYVILDIFSRYVVGWMLAHRESAALAQRLIAESCRNSIPTMRTVAAR